MADFDPTTTREQARTWLIEHGDMLYAMAVRDLADAATAEDVVQETLLAALMAEKTFEHRASRRTWLVGILRHKIADAQRRTARERGRVESMSEEDQDLQRAAGTWLAHGKWVRFPAGFGTRNASAAEVDEFRTAIARCVDRLPARAAQALRQIEHQGMSAEQAGKNLGLTTTNMNVLMYRARLALRACLERSWFKSTV